MLPRSCPSSRTGRPIRISAMARSTLVRSWGSDRLRVRRMKGIWTRDRAGTTDGRRRAGSPRDEAGARRTYTNGRHDIAGMTKWCIVPPFNTHQERGMRTNIEIDDLLMSEAMAVSGARTKKETVEIALRELLSSRRQRQAIEDMLGLGWDGNLDEMRAERDILSR
ncbi:type II toxin-antitoxin system VapB family antitoxin [Enterovirga rhinocerotis]